MKRIVLITFLVIFSIYNICYIYTVANSINETYEYAEAENPLWGETYLEPNPKDPYSHNFGVLAFLGKEFKGQECFEFLLNNSSDISSIDFYYDDNNDLNFKDSKSFFEYYKQNENILNSKSFEVYILGINGNFYIEKIAIAESNINETKNLKLFSYYDVFEEFYKKSNLNVELSKDDFKRDICGLIVCIVMLLLNVFLIVLTIKKKKINIAIWIFVVLINIVCLVMITNYYSLVGIVES